MTDYKAMAKQTIREIEDRKRKEKAKDLESYDRIREARNRWIKGGL